MTNEEMQKTMQFIIKHQAQIVSNIQRLEETQTKAEGRVSRLDGAIVGVVNMIDKLTRAQEQLADKVTTLAEAQTRTEERVAETSERLNTFIVVVEGYIGEGGDGKSQS